MSDLIQYNLVTSGIHQFIWLDNSADVLAQYRKQFLSILESEIRNAQDAVDQQIKIGFLSDCCHTTFPEVRDVVSETVDSRRSNTISFDRFKCRIAHLSNEKDIEDKVNWISRLIPSVLSGTSLSLMKKTRRLHSY